MFAHHLDRAGQSVVEVNAYPLEHAYRTHYWQRGETVISSTILDVPASLLPGAYSFELGIYYRTTLSACQRLPQLKRSTAIEFFLGRLRCRGRL